MVIGGGQIPGVGMAYSILPFVIYAFLNVFENLEGKSSIKVFNYSLIASLFLSLQLLFDIRIAYVTLVAIFAYWIIKIVESKNFKYFLESFVFVFLIPGLLFLLIHAFWIIPTIVSHQNPVEQLGSAYSSLDAVKFFSFAKLEDSISLLHPNWPENIFGKTGFLKPEFLILPLLAYSSLLFISKIKEQKAKTYILYFAILGLLGAFLAKGVNEPFGNIYLWMFDHLPGFIIFRDPTKWYALVALSYSILIPFSIWKIYEWIKSKNKLYFQNLFLLFIVFCLLYLIRPALFGQLTGTFKSTQMPQDYVRLEKFLSPQNNFSRTLWIPTTQRFGYYSNSHPAIPAQNFYKTIDYSQILKNLRMSEAQELFQEAGVKFVIVPYDSQGEIFIK